MNHHIKIDFESQIYVLLDLDFYAFLSFWDYLTFSKYISYKFLNRFGNNEGWKMF